MSRLLGEFEVDAFPEGFGPVRGHIEPYSEAEVVRRLPTNARRLHDLPEPLEVYRDDERFWLVEERWGLVEVSPLKHEWRAWVLPRTLLDSDRLGQRCLYWPLAQLLRVRGLHLLPSSSLVRADWGVLMLGGDAMEMELRAMVRAGWGLIGQSWTAVRVDQGHVELMGLPAGARRAGGLTIQHCADGVEYSAVDLAAEHMGVRRNHAFCDAVLILEPGRRPKAHLSELPMSQAADALRRAWPIVDLHPSRRFSQLPFKLAHQCRVAQVQLSREPEDLLVLLDSMRYARPSRSAVPASPIRPPAAPSVPTLGSRIRATWLSRAG